MSRVTYTKAEALAIALGEVPSDLRVLYSDYLAEHGAYGVGQPLTFDQFKESRR